MAPNPRVARAFRAMRSIGISEEKVKPVLKKLLKLYDKNWELIEEENYRALADAIFDTEESEEAERKKKIENTESNQALDEEAQASDEPERPLKRLRLRHQEGQGSQSIPKPSPSMGGIQLLKPKEEETELPQTLHDQPRNLAESSRSNIGNSLVESHSVTPNKDKGKKPISPKQLAIHENSDSSLPGFSGLTPPAVTRRTEDDSLSSPVGLRDKGKGSMPALNGPSEKRSITGTSDALRLKERKIQAVFPVSKKQRKPNTFALIKPKDEPFTDDMPHFDVPIAVIHPESSREVDPLSQNGSIRGQDHSEMLALPPVDGQAQSDVVPDLTGVSGTNCELTNIPKESTANLQVASSPFGEVKISLSYVSAPERPNFHMPSLDAVLNTMEEKYLGSYKALDPNFSLTKLMNDMCKCFLDLGTGSTSESQEIVDEILANDSSQKNCEADASCARIIPSNLMNGLVNGKSDDNESPDQLPRLPGPSNETNIGEHTVKDNSVNVSDLSNGKEHNSPQHTNSESLVVVQQCRSVPGCIGSLHDVEDISKGQERVTISLINEINNELPPSFHYIPQNVVFQNAYLNFPLARVGDENCCSNCLGDCLLQSTPCACARETGGEFAYTPEGLVKEEILQESVSMNRDPQKHCLYYCKECPLERSKNEDTLEPCKGHLVRKFIKECWWKCGCSKQCGNRVVQRGIKCNLQVFMTPGGKGWGLRTLNELPKGTFVCEYVGEVLTNSELYDRVSRTPKNEDHAYPVLLDADWGSEGVLKDEEALCLDATYYGNVARFINHRCFDSNLVEIPVEIETPDHHYYHLAFFTTRKVQALEELTWDYGIDFDDHDHPVKAFRCQCGSKFCRNIKRSRRTRSGGSRR